MGISQTDKNLRDLMIFGEATRERITSLPKRKIELTGISATQEPYRVVRTQPEFGLVLACTAGEGMVQIDGNWQRCAEGMTLLNPPHCISAYYTTPGSTWEFAWVHLSTDLEMPWPQECALLPADAEPFHHVILGLYRESIGGADMAHLSVWAELLLLEARRLMLSTGVIGSSNRLRALWEAVEQDIAHPWTAHELAQRVFLSEGQLRVVCQQVTGRSPMEQVTFLRMRRAATLLVSTNYSIGQTALAVGYTNPFAFSTAFKRVIGVAPSRYQGTK
jgi:AraC-like DNA-binding protein